MKNRQEFHDEADKKEKKFKKEVNSEGGFDKKDPIAMLISAFLTIFPVCALIVIALGLFVLWLFGAL
jgi:hypothetical protein